MNVTTDTEGEQKDSSLGIGPVSPGVSQSQVIMAWGTPPYILDSQADDEHEMWQYPHAVVVFKGTKVQQVLAR